MKIFKFNLYLSLAAASLFILLPGCRKQSDTPVYTDVYNDIYQEIKSVNKMVFASMSISKTAKTESSAWYKVGKRIAVYSYDTYMQAYIDLSSLSPDDLVFDEDTKSVNVSLPAIQTELTGRDMQMQKEYENIGLLRSDIDSKERAEMKEMANKSLKQEVEDNPAFKKQLIETAQQKARTYFEQFFRNEGYTANINFKA